MKCICGAEIDGSLVVVDAGLDPSHIPVCPACFNLWANQDFKGLIKRMGASGKAGEKILGVNSTCPSTSKVNIGTTNRPASASSSAPNDANDAKRKAIG